MPNLSQSPQKNKVLWGVSIFLVATTIISFIWVPIYVSRHGLSAVEIALFIFYFIATGMSITVGYHRLYAHVTYKAHPVIQFLLLFFGAAAFEQSAVKWSSQHRDHHTYLDTDRDPYSVTKGFWHAHMGWLMWGKDWLDYDNVKDLMKNKLAANQHKYFELWAVVSGVVVPVLIGAAFGHALGAFLIGVCFRIVFVHQATFCINSFCHMIGNATYDPHTTARDHWMIAILTFGEGYHNFHHRFPADYRNGIRWYHFDPSKWVIGFLSFFGLTYDLKTAPYFRIMHARLTAENYRAHELLSESLHSHHPLFDETKQLLERKYARVQNALHRFEQAASIYQSALREARAAQVSDLKKAKKAAHPLRMRLARYRFRNHYQNWLSATEKITLGRLTVGV